MKKKTKFIIGTIAVLGIAAAIIIPKHPLYYLDYEIKDNYAVITDCKDKVKKVDIPEKIFGHKVEGIAAHAFSVCEAEEINIPDTIRFIDLGAFSLCKNITYIEIPDSVECMASDIFANCDKLVSVKLPEKLKCINWTSYESYLSIHDYSEIKDMIPFNMFDHCQNFKKIDIPDNVTSISSGAFIGCSSLKEISLPKQLKEIWTDAFSYCTSLEKITFPDNLEIIKERAFLECNALDEVTIPASVTEIGDYAFGYYMLRGEIIDGRDTSEYKLNDDFIIKGYKNTAAEKYAKENDIEFIALN